MWTAIAFLALLVILAVAGLTGFGVYDSRDSRFSLRSTAGPAPDRLYEDLVTPGRRRILPRKRHAVR